MARFFIADPHFENPNIIVHNNRQPWCERNPDWVRPAKTGPFERDRSKSTSFPFRWVPSKDEAREQHDHWIAYLWNKMVSKSDTVYVLGDFTYKRHGFYTNALHGKKVLIRGNHDEMSQEEERNFSGACDYLRIRLSNKRPLIMSHYPMRSWEGACYGWYSIYGHNHGRIPEFPWLLSFDVGVDVWGYLPVPEEVLLAKFAEKEAFLRANNINGYIDDESDFFSLYNFDKTPRWQRVEALRRQNLSLMMKFGYTEVYRGTPLEAVFSEYIKPSV